MAKGMTTDEKARTYLGEGRVKVQHLSDTTALVHVTGSGGGDPYYVKYTHGLWKCDCPAHIPECAHVKACMLITELVNDESLARKGEVFDSRDSEIDKILEGL